MTRDARLAIDIGGTFTDVVVQVGGDSVHAVKVLSTPKYYGEALVRGAQLVLRAAGVEPERVLELIHATTVVTNTVFERKGARTALLTTHGFSDVLELARMRVPALFDLMWRKPDALVPRHWRCGIRERIGANGEVVTPLDVPQAIATIKRLKKEKIEAVAVCLLHSYANAQHERRLGELLAEHLPGIPVTLSSSLTPDVGEYERSSTAVVNAYAQPLVSRYLGQIRNDLEAARLNVPMRLMQSNGDSIGVVRATQAPVNLIESGGAAGVVGAAHIAAQCGIADILVFDMGGTSTKATLVEGGKLTRVTEFEVGAEISMGSRIAKGGGFPLLVPALDIAEVGAGGGSLGWIDAGGVLKVGPRSAGASPGPACYGLGGVLPTVTDANAALGYLPDALAGGTLPLDRKAANTAIHAHVAERLRLGVADAALGIRQIAIAAMVRAARAVSIERGHDVRRFTLVAFGGSAPLHAMDVALTLGISRVLVPRLAGVLSAVGLLAGSQGREFVRAFLAYVHNLDLGRLNAIVSAIESEACRALLEEGVAEADIAFDRSVVVRYAGQRSDLTIALPAGTLGAAHLQVLASEFEHAHDKAYGHVLPASEITITKVKVRTHARRAEFQRLPPLAAGSRAPSQRPAYFEGIGWVDTPVYHRTHIGASAMEGPAIIDDDDCTTLVPPQCGVRVTPEQHLLIESPQGARP
jgi:N-methylhydantoinase A